VISLFGNARAAALAAVSLAACFILVAAQLSGYAVVAGIAKCVASTAFIALALASGATGSHCGKFILAGLSLSWFGDMFLLGSGQGFFLAGLVSFLFGHVAYVVAFFVLGVQRRRALAAMVPVLVITFLAMAWLTPQLPQEMVLPVHSYAGVISLMVISAYGAGGPWLIAAGATLFYVSDLSVAAMQFADPGWPTYVLGLPFYYTGQILLATSARFVRLKG
jgi:uncharacterized membrane protein YhhN